MSSHRSTLPSLVVSLTLLTLFWSVATDSQQHGDEINFVYHNHNQMVVHLHSIAWKCRNIMRLYDIGKSVRDRTLYVLEISDNPGVHEVGKNQV